MKYLTVFAIAILSVGIGLVGCAKEKASEAPKQQYVTKNLVPATAEVKGADFDIKVDSLQIGMNVDSASKEPVETPTLEGHYTVTNTSKDVLDVQGVTVEYLDEQGKAIAFSSGEKIAKATTMLSKLNPGETTDGSLELTFPRAALKNLRRIDLNLVFIPSPLKRETLTMPEKVEG
jgi:hypothetical protein